MIDFRMLGPLEAFDDGRPLPLGSRQQRAVLAILLLHANEPVGTDRLIDSVWGDRPPPTAATTVQVYVSRLRKILGRELLVTKPPGYMLRVAPDQLDLGRAERLIAAAHGTKEALRRAALLRDAVALWRGPALAEFAYDELARAEIERLDELRLATLESAVDAELELGRHAEVAGELEASLEQHPLRERMRAQLMLALYRSGRQAEALAVYREGRRRLVDDLGLEPGPQLRQLQQQILAQDPTLDAVRHDRDGARARARDERKVLTALFAELAPFDDPDQPPIDPEEARDLVEPRFRRIREELERFGGSVAMVVGDAALAVFGAPAAQEDHAERAVRAGLAVRELIRTSIDETPAAPRIELRVGISTGEALVPAGEVGQWVGSAFGAVFGTADRLRKAAPANAVVVAEPTFRATRDVIDYQLLDGLGGWEAVAPTTAIRSRGPQAGQVTFVGRSEEMRRVAQRFDAAADTRTAHLVTVIGAPGIGKTRLLRELETRLGTDALWLQGRSLPYGDGVAYWALAEAVKSHVGILDTDAPVEAVEKLRRMCAGTVPEAVENQLRLLLGLERGEVANERSAAFDSWRRFLERVGTARLVVLTLEDVHWADDGLLDFVEHVAASRHGSPLVLLCTARRELLERRPSWGAGAQDSTTIELSPLADEQMRTLVDALAEDPAGVQDLADRVVPRVGGNPLFAEEYVRTLLAGELGEEQVPHSVHSVIAARLDALPPDAKALLQDAAVIGKVFWPGSVAAINSLSRAGCEAELEPLVGADFLQHDERSAVHDEPQFAFRHILIRDVAYEQIPRTERSDKHRRAAEWIQAHARADDAPELMAHHYLNAFELAGTHREQHDLLEPTADALRRAGERARQLYANDDSAAYFRRALTILEAAPAEAGWRSQHLLAVLESLGDVLELSGNHVEAEAVFGTALEQVADSDRLRRARLLRKQGTSRQLQSRIDGARATFAAADDALGARPRGADWWQERCAIAIQRLQLLYFGAPIAEFAAEIGRVRPLVETRGTAAQRSFLLNWLAMAALRRDRYVAGSETLAHSSAALAAALESGSIAGIAYMHFSFGFCLLWARQLDEAESELREGLELAERLGDATTRVRALNYLAVIERWRGRPELARELANRTLEAAQSLGMGEYLAQAHATLAWAALRDGDVATATAESRKAWPLLDEFAQRVVGWMPLWPLLGMALSRGDDADAVEHARLIVDPTRQPMPPAIESELRAAIAASDRGDKAATRRSLSIAAQLAEPYGYL